MPKHQADREVTPTGSVIWVKRSYHSITWLRTADITRERAVRIGGGKIRPQSPDDEVMRAFVLSAVTAAGAFLEAHINELFDDAHTYLDQPGNKVLLGLSVETQLRIAALWPYIKRYRTLEKYEIVLKLGEADPLERGSEPAQSAQILGKIRNHYLHYQPDSVRDGVAEGDDLRLSQELEGRITLPRWDNSNEDLFPSRALCPDLARWAVESCVRYTDAFCDGLGIGRRYDHVRPKWVS